MLAPQFLEEAEQQDKTKYKPAIKNQTAYTMGAIQYSQLKFQSYQGIDQQPQHGSRKCPNNTLEKCSYFRFQEKNI